MKVLFFPLYTLTPHLDTEFELIYDHIKKNDDVFLIKCNGELPTCLNNIDHTKNLCILCKARVKTALNVVKFPKQNIIPLPKIKPDYSLLKKNFVDTEDLINYEYKGLEFGRAVASNLVYLLNRDHKFNTKINAKKIYHQLQCALYIHQSSISIFQDVKPDLIYIFNGRFCEPKVVIMVCNQLSIPFYTHERAGYMNRYLLFKNTIPHDIAANTDEINKLWNEAPINKEEIAKQWFLERRAGVDQGWYSFIRDQKINELPPGFDKMKKNIVIYNSTTEENFTIRGYENPLYKDDNDAIIHIIDAFKGDPDYHIYLRVHPNLKNIENSQMKEIRSMKFSSNFTIIPPESNIHSYVLLDNAKIIISFGSTIGIEATFWNKPSILVGRAIYENLDCVYRPRSHDELIKMIKSDLSSKPLIGALKFAYFQVNCGTPYKYFKQTGVSQGQFLGVSLIPSVGAQISALIWRFLAIRSFSDLKYVIKTAFHYIFSE